MKNRKKIGIYFFFLIVIFSSCKKEYEAGIEPDCKVIEYRDTSYSFSYLLSYDSQNRLSKFHHQYSATGFFTYNYVYLSNRVLVITTSSSLNIDTIVLIIGSNGYASQKIRKYGSGINPDRDTTFFQYDSNNFLIKSIENYWVYSSTITNYDLYNTTTELFSISNENIVSLVHSENGYNYTQEWQYFTDKINRQNVDPFYDNYGYFGLLGRTSKNLTKTQVYTNSGPSTYSTYNFSYEFTDYDYVSKLNYNYTSGTFTVASQYDFKYTCKD